MNTKVGTIKISGKTFLKCDSDSCQWNAICTSDGPSIPGIEISNRDKDMPHVCNFGIAAYRILGLPEDCHYHEKIKEVLSRITYCRGDNEPYPVHQE